MSTLRDLLEAVGPIVAGLALGTLARFGIEVEEGRAISRNKVFGHLMMLGMIGLIVECGGNFLGVFVPITPVGRALVAASAALLGLKFLKRYRAWSAREADRRYPVTPSEPPHDH